MLYGVHLFSRAKGIPDLAISRAGGTVWELAAAGTRAGAGLAGVQVDLAWRDADGRQFIAEVKSGRLQAAQTKTPSVGESQESRPAADR